MKQRHLHGKTHSFLTFHRVPQKSNKMRLGLLLLIGIPGSGKTTLAQNFKEKLEHDESTLRLINVCYDDFITFQNFQETEWKSARNSVKKKVENLVIALKNNMTESCSSEFKHEVKSITENSDVVVLLDDNMYLKSMRYSLYQIAKKHRISFCQVFVECSLEDALTRNSMRKSTEMVPPHVIKNMFDKIEPPDNKNYWERFSIRIKAFSNLNEYINELFCLLDTSLNNNEYENCIDVEQKELSILQCRTNVLHQSDIALRFIVGQKIKSVMKNSENIKQLRAELNGRKSDILTDIKTGNIQIPDEIIESVNQDALNKSLLVNFLIDYF